MGKRKKTEIIEEIEDNENEIENENNIDDKVKDNEYGDDIFADFDGIINDKSLYYIYRENAITRQNDYLDKMSPPCSIDDIKQRYGGGIYQIYARDAVKGTIKTKKIISIAGRAIELNEPVKNVPIPNIDNLSMIKEVVSLMNEIGKGKNDNHEVLNQMFQSQIANMNTVNTMIMGMFGNQLNLMEQIRDTKEGSSMFDVINSGIETLGDLLAVKFSQGKGNEEKNISGNVKNNVNNINNNGNNNKNIKKINITQLMDILNQAQSSNYPYEDFKKVLKEYASEYLPILKTFEYPDLLKYGKKFGMKEINTDWLKGLYNELQSL